MMSIQGFIVASWITVTVVSTSFNDSIEEVKTKNFQQENSANLQKIVRKIKPQKESVNNSNRLRRIDSRANGSWCWLDSQCASKRCAGSWNDFKCQKKSSKGGACSRFWDDECESGMSCSVMEGKCYHYPRHEDEPCGMSNPCKSGLYCQIPLAKCKVSPPIDVPTKGTNLALQGTASQSSTYASNFGSLTQVASNAIDGNSNGDRSSHNSVSHTNADDGAWWKVNLNGVATVNKIIIWNRTDHGSSSRLSDSDVRILDSSGMEVAIRHIDNASGIAKFEFDFEDVVGSYVEVKLRGTNVLNLAEVQVFGHMADPNLASRPISKASNAPSVSTRLTIGSLAPSNVQGTASHPPSPAPSTDTPPDVPTIPTNSYSCPPGTNLFSSGQHCDSGLITKSHEAIDIFQCKDGCKKYRCNYFLYKNDPSASLPYHCALFSSCVSSHSYEDGDAAITCRYVG